MTQAQHLFIVRIWQEPGSTNAEQWRGEVLHNALAYRYNFAALNDLYDFITLRLAPASRPSNVPPLASSNAAEPDDV